MKKTTPAGRGTKKEKPYKAAESSMPAQVVKEPEVAYGNPVKENLAFQYLGGSSLLSISRLPRNDYEFIELINSGIPKQSFDYLAGITGLPYTELAVIFNTTDRTLRRYDANTRLNREQTERAIDLAQLYSLGNEVFGDLHSFRHWIDSPIIALGGKKPKYFLSSSRGIHLLTKMLGRIQHGVFS